MKLICLLVSLLAAALPVEIPFQRGDQMPDFSRVGYRWGDVEIPTVPVVKTLKAPKDGADATALIQKAIDGLKKPGAILLTAGTYNIEGTLYIRRDGVVLRGEGQDKTILFCKGQPQRNLIEIGYAETTRTLSKEANSKIVDPYVPFGALSVAVARPQLFKPGDHVCVFRPATKEWLHDIRMDRIAQHVDPIGRIVHQWTRKDFSLYYERIVTAVDGNRIWLDNPVVLAIDRDKYGEGRLIGCSLKRVSECGVENLRMVSDFDPSVKREYGGKEYCSDENHGWKAVVFRAAEHCWVRDVTSEHFGYALSSMEKGSLCITALRCSSLEPVSVLIGARRYCFNINGGECCLVKDCLAQKSRHGFVTNGTVCGPNVYTNGEMRESYTDAGPHNRWTTGTLYDCIKTNTQIDVQDRGGSGTGHGWAGGNIVMWNCEASSIIAQSVWHVVENYVIGCIAAKRPGWYGTGSHDFYKGKFVGGVDADFEERPDGVWISHGKHVEPRSLYDWQMEQRKAAGIKAAPAKCYKNVWK
ncbi:MAG: hypothetical protein IJV01_06420 [Bacteroidales bacterium]|nr:hypothetical protein [Bacteroidales bacterium]